MDLVSIFGEECGQPDISEEFERRMTFKNNGVAKFGRYCWEPWCRFYFRRCYQCFSHWDQVEKVEAQIVE